MESTANLRSGFKYNIEHLRSVATMEQMGVSCTQLSRRTVKDIEYVVLSTEDVTNLIPTEGLTYLIGAGLTGVTQIASWFLALFEANYTPVAGVTAATFPADATESVAYDETTRVAWVPGAVNAGAVNNAASQAVFTMNATKTIYGIAQTSVSTKGALTGTLTSVAKFAVAKAVVTTDILNITSAFTSTST